MTRGYMYIVLEGPNGRPVRLDFSTHEEAQLVRKAMRQLGYAYARAIPAYSEEWDGDFIFA